MIKSESFFCLTHLLRAKIAFGRVKINHIYKLYTLIHAYFHLLISNLSHI